MVAGISLRCQRVAGTRLLAAEWAHGVASVGEAALGAVAIGTAAIGVDSAGAEAIGTAAIGTIIIIIIMTSSSSAASAFRSGAWGGDIRTDTDTATHTDTTMVMVTRTDTIMITGIITATPVTAIKDTATVIVPAEDLRSRSYNAG